jgi:hypothetical protein
MIVVGGVVTCCCGVHLLFCVAFGNEKVIRDFIKKGRSHNFSTTAAKATVPGSSDSRLFVDIGCVWHVCPQLTNKQVDTYTHIHTATHTKQQPQP